MTGVDSTIFECYWTSDSSTFFINFFVDFAKLLASWTDSEIGILIKILLISIVIFFLGVVPLSLQLIIIKSFYLSAFITARVTH